MEHLLEMLISRYGYIGLTLALALGIVGVPVPDEALLTYSGYLVGNGTLLGPLVVLCAFLGAASASPPAMSSASVSAFLSCCASARASDSPLPKSSAPSLG